MYRESSTVTLDIALLLTASDRERACGVIRRMPFSSVLPSSPNPRFLVARKMSQPSQVFVVARGRVTPDNSSRQQHHCITVLHLWWLAMAGDGSDESATASS
jgi:hypothetical protein